MSIINIDKLSIHNIIKLKIIIGENVNVIKTEVSASIFDVIPNGIVDYYFIEDTIYYLLYFMPYVQNYYDLSFQYVAKHLFRNNQLNHLSKFQKFLFEKKFDIKKSYI